MHIWHQDTPGKARTLELLHPDNSGSCYYLEAAAAGGLHLRLLMKQILEFVCHFTGQNHLLVQVHGL